MKNQFSSPAIGFAIFATFLIVSCEEKEKPVETSVPAKLNLPMITDISPAVPEGAEVTLHVILTTSENPFSLDPVLKVLNTTAKTRKASFGEGGTFSDADITAAIKGLGIAGILGMRLQSIQETGPADRLIGGSSVEVNEVDDGTTMDLDERVVADAEGKFHSFVVVQIENP